MATSDLFRKMYKEIVGAEMTFSSLQDALRTLSKYDDVVPFEASLPHIDDLRAMTRFEAGFLWSATHSYFSDALLTFSPNAAALTRPQLGAALFSSFVVAYSYAYGGDWSLQASDFRHIYRLSEVWAEFVPDDQLLQFFNVVVPRILAD